MKNTNTENIKLENVKKEDTKNKAEHDCICSSTNIPKTDCFHTGENIADTDFGYTLSLINGKYKLIIIYWLANHKSVMRYNELKKCLGNISHKEMEKDALIIRKEYPQIPPKVEYSLSDRGKSLIPILVSMCQWGGDHKNDVI